LIHTKNGVMKKIIPLNIIMRDFRLNPKMRIISAMTIDKVKNI